METRGFGGELLSIQTAIFDEVTFDCSADKVANFLEAVISHPKPVIWFAHYAQYDWRYIIEYLQSREDWAVEIGMRSDNVIYEIRISHEDGLSVMRDSYAIYPYSLSKMAKRFCPEIPKLEIDVANFDVTNDTHIEYAKRDALILRTALPRFFGMIEKHFGVWPNATAASTALKAWQFGLPKDTVFSGSKWGPDEAFIRQGYYGGLVFLTTNRPVANCVTFDRNSSYPASMVQCGVPTGRVFDTVDYQTEKMGIYRVRVRAPEDLIVPILPGRDARGGMRWFRGVFDSVLTNRELIFAANNGYEILEVYEGKVWESISYPFNSFIELCKSIRRDYKDSAEEFIAKLMQNSLYGKYGSRRERTRLLEAAAAFDAMGKPLPDIEPWDESGHWYIQTEFDELMLCKPEWAVFITAHSRLALLKEIYTIGPEHVVYGDTDSITFKSTAANAIDEGVEYGQWKREKEWQVFRAIAPKVYTGILKDGTYKGAAKGMPQKAMVEKNWQELLYYGATEAATYSIASLKQAFKSGVQEADWLRRRSSTLDNSVNFIVLENGDVRCKIAA